MLRHQVPVHVCFLPLPHRFKSSFVSHFFSTLLFMIRNRSDIYAFIVYISPSSLLMSLGAIVENARIYAKLRDERNKKKYDTNGRWQKVNDKKFSQWKKNMKNELNRIDIETLLLTFPLEHNLNANATHMSTIHTTRTTEVTNSGILTRWNEWKTKLNQNTQKTRTL